MSDSIHDPLHDRGKQMEDLFFKKQDAALIEKMRQDRKDKEQREQLVQASGIEDAEAIDGLVKAGVSADSLVAVSVIPLVAMAWADRRMEYAERVAVLKAAETVGMEKGSISYAMVENWLENEPSSDLLDAWKSYISAVKEKAAPEAISQMKTTVLNRAEEVAKAAGGFLGLGNRVSDSEQKLLDELTAAF